jgi:hypothetical protein
VPCRPVQATILSEQHSRALRSLHWMQVISKKRFALFLQSQCGYASGNHRKAVASQDAELLLHPYRLPENIPDAEHHRAPDAWDPVQLVIACVGKVAYCVEAGGRKNINLLLRQSVRIG